MSSKPLDKLEKAAASDSINSLVGQVCEAVSGIRFGSVEIVIHDGRVVQIERRERVRLERQGGAEATS